LVERKTLANTDPATNKRVTKRIRPEVPVTPDRIALAALELLDQAHMESDLTVRALASRLGVKAPSLYAHVSGIDEVIDLIHGHINASIDLALLDGTSDLDDFKDFIVSYRNAYRAHPLAASIISNREINLDHALRVYEEIAAFLLRVNVPADKIMPLMALLDSLVLGSAVEPFAAGFNESIRWYRKNYPTLAVSLAATSRTAIDELGFQIGANAFIELIRLHVPRD
jgi:AcrR family transcriptional regulator